MFWYAVGAGAFVTLAEEEGEVCFAACAGDAAHGVCDDGGGVDEVFPQEWEEWEYDGGGVAAG